MSRRLRLSQVKKRLRVLCIGAQINFICSVDDYGSVEVCLFIVLEEHGLVMAFSAVVHHHAGGNSILALLSLLFHKFLVLIARSQLLQCLSCIVHLGLLKFFEGAAGREGRSMLLRRDLIVAEHESPDAESEDQADWNEAGELVVARCISDSLSGPLDRTKLAEVE